MEVITPEYTGLVPPLVIFPQLLPSSELTCHWYVITYPAGVVIPKLAVQLSDNIWFEGCVKIDEGAIVRVAVDEVSLGPHKLLTTHRYL